MMIRRYEKRVWNYRVIYKKKSASNDYGLTKIGAQINNFYNCLRLRTKTKDNIYQIVQII